MDVEIWTSDYDSVDPEEMASRLMQPDSKSGLMYVASVLVMDRESDRRKEWTDG